jgi:AcrR family transcriptional regulator
MAIESTEHNAVISGRPHKATHHDIILTAWQLFEEVGFEATTMAQIAEHCGMSRRTLFNYFPNKYSLLFPGTHESLDAFEEQLLARPSDEKIFDALIACVDASNNKMQELSKTYVPGPQVIAARLSEGASNYNRDVWAFELEQIALTKLGTSVEAKIQAALIGVITAQVISELFKLMRSSKKPLTEQAALGMVLNQLANLLSK